MYEFYMHQYAIRGGLVEIIFHSYEVFHACPKCSQKDSHHGLHFLEDVPYCDGEEVPLYTICDEVAGPLMHK
jgi:hypothetical protein